MTDFPLIIVTISNFIIIAVTPRVAIIMGSDSDLPVMKDAAKVLNEFDVPCEVSFNNLFTLIWVFGLCLI